jgi:hypothetical protein
MKLNRKRVTLGLVTLGLVAGLAGTGVALAATSPTPTTSSAGTAPMGNGHCRAMTGSMFGKNSPMAAVASYLGLSPTDLREQMQSGKSLADIARAQGKSVAGLKDAMVSAMTRNLDVNTRLTAQQKADMLAEMKEHLDAMLARTSMMSGGGMGSMGSHMGGMGR